MNKSKAVNTLTFRGYITYYQTSLNYNFLNIFILMIWNKSDNSNKRG